MCKFCEEGKSPITTRNKIYIEKWPIYNPYIGKAEWHLRIMPSITNLYNVECIFDSVKINYCPFCGRNLKGE